MLKPASVAVATDTSCDPMLTEQWVVLFVESVEKHAGSSILAKPFREELAHRTLGGVLAKFVVPSKEDRSAYSLDH